MKYLNESPLVIALVAGLGMFLSTLDTGIINVAIPTLLKEFKAPIATVIWTVTLYTLTLSATILLFGRLADRVGRLKIYMLGLSLFAVSSFLCGTSSSIWFLIASRALQGLSAAMLQATAIALVTTRLENQHQTKAMGLLGTLIGLGPLMGPSLGGFILSTAGWRWVFWINLPLCLLGIIGCKKLRPVNEALHDKPIYYTNLALLALSIFSMLFAMSLAGHGTNTLHTAIIAAIILAIIYFNLEARSKHPLIPLELFKSFSFFAPILTAMTFGGATIVVFMLPPIYLQQLKHFEPWRVGIVCLSSPLGMVSASQISARLAQAKGTLLPMLTGLSIMLLTLLGLTQIAIDSNIALFIALLVCYGVGVGLCQIPTYINLTQQFKTSRQAFIASLTRMTQNLSATFAAGGAAMLIGQKTSLNPNHLMHGIVHGWWLAISLCILAWAMLMILVIKQR